MTYDGTDPDDDGVVESDVDNQSTTTETLDTESVRTNQGIVWDQQNGDALNQQSPFVLIEDTAEITSTTYTNAANMVGVVDGTRMPSAATLYGRLIFESGGTVDQEASVVPEVFDSNKGTRELDGLEVTIPQGDTFSYVDSGWQTVDSFPYPDEIAIGRGLLAKLSTQTGGDVVDPISNSRFGVAFEWRLD